MIWDGGWGAACPWLTMKVREQRCRVSSLLPPLSGESKNQTPDSQLKCP